MNEFYELKPGESVRNILMYNSPTVILTDLAKKNNFLSGENLSFGIYTSHYGDNDLHDVLINVRLSLDGKIIKHECVQATEVKNGMVSKLCDFSYVLPKTYKPCAMKLYITMDGDDIFSENEWELYLFPQAKMTSKKMTSNGKLIVVDSVSKEVLLKELNDGKDVLLFCAEPFMSMPTSFRISLAGRTSGNLATVIADHPALKDLPHEGFCGWQFVNLLEGGNAVCFESDEVVFNPIIEVVSTHKCVVRQSAMFEFNALNGRLLVCSLNFDKNDPAANWLKSQLISYAQSEEFTPQDTINKQQLLSLTNTAVKKAVSNSNLAFNLNDKTATRKK